MKQPGMPPDFSHREPTVPPRLELLQEAYAYDPTLSQEVTESLLPDGELRLTRWIIDRADGHRQAGVFLRPREERAYPCALLIHALSSDKETMVRHFGRALAERGVASMALDLHLHGERRRERREELSPLEYMELARESVIEHRRALDLLGARPDVDGDRIGLLGYSLGGMMGTILAGVDSRIRAAALLVSGDPLRAGASRVPALFRELADLVSPSVFAPHISPRPVFFLNGKWDSTVSRPAAAALHDAAEEPKEVVWADAGHLLPPEVAVQAVDWLAAQLYAVSGDLGEP